MHAGLEELTEDEPGQRAAFIKKTALLKVGGGPLPVIGQSDDPRLPTALLELQPGIARAHISVEGLPHRAGVDNQITFIITTEGAMGMGRDEQVTRVAEFLPQLLTFALRRIP